MPATLKLDVKAITELIEQLTSSEKIEIFDFLRRIVVKKRLEQFIQSKKGISLSLDEIKEEVEKVREERYCLK